MLLFFCPKFGNLGREANITASPLKRERKKQTLANETDIQIKPSIPSIVGTLERRSRAYSLQKEKGRGGEREERGRKGEPRTEKKLRRRIFSKLRG